MASFEETNLILEGTEHKLYKCHLPSNSKLEEIQEWLDGDMLADSYLWDKINIMPLESNSSIFDPNCIYFKSKEDATMFLLSFY